MAIAPRYRAYEDAWATGARVRVRVLGQEQEVGFFHAFRGERSCVFFIDRSKQKITNQPINGQTNQ